MPQQPQQPPLARMAQRQKRDDLHPLVDATEGQMRAAFADARGEVAHLLSLFADAYAHELARMNADRDEDEEPTPRRVPLHWLTNSGWGPRVEHALSSAAHQAGQRSLAHLVMAHDDAAQMGQDHAEDLLREALRPAVLAIAHRGKQHTRRRRGR